MEHVVRELGWVSVRAGMIRIRDIHILSLLVSSGVVMLSVDPLKALFQRKAMTSLPRTKSKTRSLRKLRVFVFSRTYSKMPSGSYLTTLVETWTGMLPDECEVDCYVGNCGFGAAARRPELISSITRCLIEHHDYAGESPRRSSCSPLWI